MSKSVLSKATRIVEVRIAGVCLVFLLSCLLFPAPSRADSPTEQVRATVDKVLTILRNSNLKSEAQRNDMRARLAQVINPRFDFTEMAKRSLGPHWARRSAEEQQEFVKIFAGLLRRSYADNIESYSTQNVLYTREVEDKDYAEVDTKIVADKGEDVSINYKLHNVNKEWKIYDLVIEDISVVNNYRSQFDRVIAKSSYVDLVRMMKEKQS
jgi:phospholipid transport system substrate-binding protein